LEPAAPLEAATFVPVIDLSFEICIAEIDLEPSALLKAATFVTVIDLPLEIVLRGSIWNQQRRWKPLPLSHLSILLGKLYCGDRFGTSSAVGSRYLCPSCRFPFEICIAEIDLELAAPLEAATFVQVVDYPLKFVLRKSIWNHQRC